MRLLFGVVAVLALAGCEADGRPSKLLGSALGGFAKGYSNGSATVQQAQGHQNPQPMQAAPQSTPQPVANAFFTGQATQVQTVTGGMAWQCQYNYAGQVFVLLFESYCPPNAAVR